MRSILSSVDPRFRLLAAIGACAIILGCGSSSGSDDSPDPGSQTGGGGGGGGGTGGGGTGGGGGGTGTGTTPTPAQIEAGLEQFAAVCRTQCEKDRECNPEGLSAGDLADEYAMCMEDCDIDTESEDQALFYELIASRLTVECINVFPQLNTCVNSLTCSQIEELDAWDEESSAAPPFCASEYIAFSQNCQNLFDFGDDIEWEDDIDPNDPSWFTCDDGTRIPASWICDGDDDCPGAEDEADC